VKNLLQITTT